MEAAFRRFLRVRVVSTITGSYIQIDRKIDKQTDRQTHVRLNRKAGVPPMAEIVFIVQKQTKKH